MGVPSQLSRKPRHEYKRPFHPDVAGLIKQCQILFSSVMEGTGRNKMALKLNANELKKMALFKILLVFELKNSVLGP